MQPPRRTSVTVLLLAAALGLAASGCGGEASSPASSAHTAAVSSAPPDTGAPGSSGTPGFAKASPSAKSSSSAKPSKSAKPSSTPKATATPKPTNPPATETPTASSEATPTATASVGPGSICTGTLDNKIFWSQAAGIMSWDVYCPVLPKGWHVNNGSWATAKGGRVEISYSGPSGAVLELKEGTFCTGGISLCSAHDTIVGAAAFGDRVGSLDTLGPGLGFAIYVDAGQAPMWQMTGNGMDQATFAGFGAALKKVPKA